ncbi:transposase [Streptomyces cinereospinus]|uniref:Transposase n=1 Tax=Streptomyces cinereospinus TaxID=285561 RepID=A0ABV5N8S0_9ACTN
MHARVREELGREAQPTAGVIDSRSVKADAVVGADSRGFDGGKLVNGRKRHVVVDTLGLLLGVMVTAADVGDRTAARVLPEQVAEAHHRLALVWADGGYTGNLVEYCLATSVLVLAIVKRSDDQKGCVALPKRWIVERFFAHLMRSRRLVRDFERRTTSAEVMVYWPVPLAGRDHLELLPVRAGHHRIRIRIRIRIHHRTYDAYLLAPLPRPALPRRRPGRQMGDPLQPPRRPPDLDPPPRR